MPQYGTTHSIRTKQGLPKEEISRVGATVKSTPPRNGCDNCQLFLLTERDAGLEIVWKTLPTRYKGTSVLQFPSLGHSFWRSIKRHKTSNTLSPAHILIEIRMGICGSKEQRASRKSSQAAQSKAATQAPHQSDGTAPSARLSVEDKYEIDNEIGRGAFSVVKKAKDKTTGKEYAVKFIEKKFVDQQDLVLLGREIEIMKRVMHKNVLRLEEVYEVEDTIALVMELVTGGELFYKIVERGNYSEQDAANIVRQIVQGVAYLHSNGICHRDLKPENLLCSGLEDKEEGFKPFRVIIADFGLSKEFDGGEALETSCGTPDYVAPEVITAEGTYNQSVDMWSIGVITYVLLCGFSPFLSSTQTGLFEKIIKVEYDFPEPEWSNISPEAKDFIRHLLLRDPNSRYTAEQCLGHRWLTGQFGTTEALDNIGKNMAGYNQQRAATKKNL
ncbi:hypothetical protein PROFUN_07651 [Planoprotostelium fungivorum]|uniref:non-specific serine/threonine protein kinase n=1 Tax=Planoprotostelium fungivorum TaxID=1890364 RepID=A0A2P6NK70_9EUKA|nr:hypothetical protein PROFUN_07651 [Planoprotostelium fungivorum]